MIPIIFAIIIGGLIILAIPVNFQKYILEEKLAHYKFSQETSAFADLDGDGRDEIIDCGGSADGIRREGCTAYSLAENFEERPIDQFNVEQLPYGETQVLSSNYDNDSYDELLMFEVSGSRLYLSAYEYPDFNTPFLRVYLDSIPLEKGKPKILIEKKGEKDVTGDGFKEVFVFAGNGYPIYPRRIYRIDFAKRQVLRSPATSVGLEGEMDDQTNFLTGNNLNPGNHEDSIELPYPDTKAYAFLFDKNLNFVFNPVAVADYPEGAVNVILNGFLFTAWNSVEQNSQRVHLEKRDLKTGTLIKSRIFESTKANLHKVSSHLLLMGKGELWIIDEKLKVSEHFQDEGYNFPMELIDLDFDGKPELICRLGHSSQYFIYSSDFDHPIKFDGQAKEKLIFFTRKTSTHKEELVVRRDDHLEFYDYNKNEWYWLRWPYYLLVFSFSGVGSWFLFNLNQKNIERKYQQERQLGQLQLLAIKNQVDPHFTLNALNSIDWMYRNNETQKASSFMGKLSRLMQQTVMNSDKISSTLWEELDFCRNYCELEKLREGDFHYSIEVSDSIDAFEIEMPKQLVFTYVENALKHGLRPKDGEKNLCVKVNESEDGILIEVIDDGVGFEKSQATKGTGKGLKIVEEMVELWKKMSKGDVKVEILSWSEGGAKVVVLIAKVPKTK